MLKFSAVFFSLGKKMGEEGEKTCPLCAEEMDLTDQQLKPCRCGYEICVWCWHHIMEMAEKDDSEGRCPACRTPYNKEKIVGAAASCDRLVAGANTEKKVRSNKGKSKTSEGWQQLSSVRVIQRNLVYVVGLPLSFADEDLLQRKDYFGLYGKVLKVSVSRTSTGAIQHFPNNTCSVYITYSKEEEALLCIQSVHGFVLEGSTLRACYGTTKYCHAWLRNQSCSNLDCLYLHEFGSQEDCFTKDELISAYTRNRIQQVTGATNSMQRRFGNALPPPADDYCNRSSANTLPGNLRISPPSSSCGRSVALPAGTSWGPRVSHNPPISGNISSSNGPQKQKLESINGSVTFSAVLASSNTILLPKKENCIKDKPLSQEKSNTIEEVVEERIDTDVQIDAYDKPVTPNSHNNGSISSKQRCSPAFKNGDKFASLSNITNSDPLLSESCGSGPVDAQKEILDEKIEKTCSEVASISLGRHLGLEEGYVEQQKTSTSSSSAGKSESSENDTFASVLKSDGGLHLEAVFSEDKDELLSFDEQRPDDPGFVSSADISGSFHVQNNLRNYHHGQLNGRVSVEDVHTAHKSTDTVSRTSGLLNGYPENNFSSAGSLSRNVEHSLRYPKDEKTTNMWRFESEGVSNGRNSTLEMGEDSIISNILSLDIDSWDESLTSPKNLARFLGETDKQQGSPKVLTPWKVHQSNQSRFSFAREESADVGSGASSVAIEQNLRHRSSGHGINLDNFGARDGSLVNGEERGSYSSSHSDFHLNKLHAVSRPQVSAPPGFSTANRAPPPGFASHERIEQHILNSPSGDYQIGASSLLRNHYQVPQAGNVVNDGDIEFIDPAILAVGKGRFADGLNSSGLDTRSSFSNQFRAFENDAKLQLLMQRSPHQNHIFDTGSSYSSFSADSFGYPSNVMEQSIVNNTSQYSQVAPPSHARSPWVPNGHWDTWKEVQGGNNLGISELHHERLGFNNFYTGFEDSKLQMHNQGNVYKPFGI